MLAVVLFFALVGLVSAKVELAYIRSDVTCTDSATQYFDAIGEL